MSTEVKYLHWYFKCGITQRALGFCTPGETSPEKKAETQTTQIFETLFQIRNAFDDKSEDEGD